MQDSSQQFQRVYDQIADQYDDLWSRHVAEPQRELTRALRLAPGERLLDLACGTGVDTLEMQRLVHPGPVIGVDCSSGMLAAARARAEAAGFSLETVEAGIEAFVEATPPESFDVISLRFCLAYFGWRETLPVVASRLRRGGRLGVLTSLATSAPQAFETYLAIAQEVGLPRATPETPTTADEVIAVLEQADLAIEARTPHEFRLWFDSGAAAAAWLRDSGFATHPAIDEIPQDALRFLLELFGRRMDERFKEARGLPLDFKAVGIVAARR